MSSSMIVFIFTVFSFTSVLSSPLRGIGRHVQGDMILVQNPFFGNRQARSNSAQPKFDIPVGEALDLFYRFGFFSLSVRVVPRDDPGSWIIREPTADIFTPNSIHKMQQNNPAPSFDPDFQVYLCDDEAELLKAYFNAFDAEGIEQPYKLYTGSWHASTKAKYLGLSKDAFDGESSFVMVRINKRRATITAMGDKKLRPEVLRAADKIQVGDEGSVMEFIKRFGSHWIHEVQVGESVYQVYALRHDQYLMAKEAALGKGMRLNPQQFAEFQKSYLAPFAVRETGRPLAASGDRTVLRFLENELVGEGPFGGSPNLLRLSTDPAKMAMLEQITDASDASAVIGLGFTSLRMSVPGIQEMEFYDGVIDTNAVLWEANI